MARLAEETIGLSESFCNQSAPACRQGGPNGLAHRSRPFRQGLTLIEVSIVLLILTTVMGLLLGMLRSFSSLRSAQDEGEALAQAYTMARRTAIMSGETVYLELNLDEETYHAYRMERKGQEVQKEIFLKERTLSSRNSLVAIVSPLGGRITAGVVTLPFYSYGRTEEVSIHLGEESSIKRTVHFPAFGVVGRIEEGETLPESMPMDDDDVREEDRLKETEF